MADPLRLTALALCAGLALWGLALGAETQHESVLESDLQQQDRIAAEGASGNLIVLTAVMVAIGVAVGASLLSRRPVLQRLAPAAVLGTATYGTVLLVQTMWPFYVALVEERSALLTNSLLAANLDGAPSVVLAPLALLLGGLLAIGWAVRRLLGTAQHSEAPDEALRSHTARTLVAVPFLAIVAWGNVRLLLALPDDQPGLGPYLVVLPAAALGCLALIGIAAAKAWHLGTYTRNARLAGSVQEIWQTLGRAELSIAALLGALAVGATFLPATAVRDLELGRVLGLTLRGHTQLMILLAVPLVPLLRLHRDVARRLAAAPSHPATLFDDSHPLGYLIIVAAVLTTALAAIGTWLFAGALWAWLLAFLPPAAVATTRLGATRAALPLLLPAFVLWAIGNTVEASYAGREGTSLLAFTTPPGVLALWRTLGAVVAASAIARLARSLTTRDRRPWPAAAGAGAALAGVALFEMPLTAWLLNRPGVDAIAVGSVVASLDPPVRITLHVMSALLAIGAALLVAFLHRPDWFRRPPRAPLPAVRRVRVKAPA